MKVRDLGELTGYVLLFGGPYSNRQATDALIAAARGAGIGASQAICTGDTVAYCGDPLGTVAALREFGCPIIAGNTEKQLAAGAPDCGCGFAEGSTCDLLSAGWFGFASKTVDAATTSWMAELPDYLSFTHAGRRYGVLHGGVSDISRFLWPLCSEAEFEGEIALLEAVVGPLDGIIAGHAGIAFERRIGNRTWINAGVIGMPPHDGRPETRFVILSEDGARIKRLAYDVVGAVQDMEAADLVQGYQVSLETGIWPSEDVLPGAMRRLTGTETSQAHSLPKG
jgi:hypothetical protein